MTTPEDIAKTQEWFNRDNLLVQVISKKKDPQVDLHFSIHPQTIALQALTGEGAGWVERYEKVITASYLLEMHQKTRDYITIHKIRILDLARRCGMVYALVGTPEEFDWWDKFREKMAEDADAYSQAAKQRATIMTGSPIALRWLDAFTPIHKSTRKL